MRSRKGKFENAPVVGRFPFGTELIARRHSALTSDGDSRCEFPPSEARPRAGPFSFAWRSAASLREGFLQVGELFARQQADRTQRGEVFLLSLIHISEPTR